MRGSVMRSGRRAWDKPGARQRRGWPEIATHLNAGDPRFMTSLDRSPLFEAAQGVKGNQGIDPDNCGGARDPWTSRFLARNGRDPPKNVGSRGPPGLTSCNPSSTMLSKYKVTYDIDPHGKMPASHFITDDPIACETFLTDLLDRKLHIRDIAHEGVALPPKQFDEMLRSAVLQLASHHVCASLKISSDDAHVRFGLPS